MMVNHPQIKFHFLRVLLIMGLLLPAIFPNSARALTQEISADADAAIRGGALGGVPQSRRNAGHLAPFAGILPPGTPFLPSYLVNTTDTSIWNHPSSDPAGIAYWPLTGKLLISDTEIEESPQPYWDGFNIFQSTLGGSLSSNCTTFTAAPLDNTYNDFSDEPAGVTINPDNNRIYFSDDVLKKIFEVNMGTDNTYCTSDDIITSVSIGIAPFSISDPEDLAYASGKLYIASGMDAEVYEFDLGANGVLGGGDDSSAALTHFDVASLGFADLEGLAYNSANGTLFLLSTTDSDTYLGEATTSGTLQRAYDLSYLGHVRRSGLTVAPASGNPSVNNVYIVNRGLDNATHPDDYNDGKIWEISLSGSDPADLIFKDGFESGDLLAWTLNNPNGGNLSASPSAALFGTYGMRAVITSTTGMEVTDDRPTLETRYRARFYFDPNSITMANLDMHNIFQGYQYAPNTANFSAILQVELRCNNVSGCNSINGGYQVRGKITDDGVTSYPTAGSMGWTTITDASHFIELDWSAATAVAANNGYLTLWVDGTQVQSVTPIDNDTRRMDRAKLGPISSLDAGTSGTYYFDAFESRRQTYIGPFLTPPTVVSVVRADANPTSVASVNYTVTFSESVTGVNAPDFALTTTGVSGAAVSGVSGSGAAYTVMVNTGTGNGTIRLDVLDDDSIIDAESTPLNGGFTSGETYTVLKSAEVQVDIAGSNVGNYDIPFQGSVNPDYAVDNGPVKMVSTNGVPIIPSMNAIWKEPGQRTSYSELMGLPREQLSTEYWFPWYNNLATASMDQGLRIGNVNATPTDIQVWVGNTQLDGFTLTAGASVRKSYDVDNGPIRVTCTDCSGSEKIIAALRVIWKEPGLRTSYSEMMGLPREQLSTEYWFPWYNNANPTTIMDQGFRIANVDAASGNTVEVWVGATKLDTIVLSAGASIRKGYSVDNGPVRIVCTTCTNTNNDQIIAALRVIWKEPGQRTSYSELMGLPKEQLSDEYWFPWYNNLSTASMDQGFRIANVDTTSSNTIEVWMGITQLDTITLNPGASTRVGYAVENGPIRIVCTTCANTNYDQIITALRVIWKGPGYRSSYSEAMGLPAGQLSTEYWFPWYNDLALTSMDQAFRISVP